MPDRRFVRGLASALALACLATASAGGASAGADVFGPISLVSEGSVSSGPAQQAEYAHDSAISADGRYVAFDGSVGGVAGVWRRDLQSGALEQVAGGDAEMPSISHDGRYISFTTNEGATLPEITVDKPDAAPHPGSVNVYVRDMGRAPRPTEVEEEALPAAERAFIVASAPSGSSEPLRYATRVGESQSGSSAVGRSAISADGSEVAFVTTAVSDLVSYPALELEELIEGKIPKPRTPAFQVAVRNIDSQQTTLVSRCYRECTEADAGAAQPVVAGQNLGAVYAGRVEFPNVPASGEWPGASISADGSTVVWMGQNVGEQVPLLSAEQRSPGYTEPLWRRIAAAGETVTERVTGGSDPSNPACAASGEPVLPSPPAATDPCQGPFQLEFRSGRSGVWPEQGGGGGNFIPRLSGDGQEVAFLSGAKPLAAGGDFGRGPEGQESDLFVADMRPGLTRDQALTPVTEIGPPGLASSAPIDEFEISPDGSQVAFTTARANFPLGQPAFVSAPLAPPGVPELFDADLNNQTLTRVTHGFSGATVPSELPHVSNPQEEDPYGQTIVGFGALSPSFSASDAIAFASSADNLVYGDGNTPPLGSSLTARENGSDIFLVHPQEFPALLTPQYVSPAPAANTEPAWTLGVTALSRSNGTVVLYAAAPGAGTLHASALGQLLARSARRSRRRSTARLQTRTVAAAAAAAHAPGGELLTLVMKLGSRYATLARQRGGLFSTVTVSFSAPGEPTLHRVIVVSFKQTTRTARAKAAKPRRGRTAGKRR